jgi:outer membrane protein assembly factor BamB
MKMMRLLLLLLLLLPVTLFAADDDWPQWRGPDNDGVARGSAPLEWSDARNVAWRAQIPGRGHSSPVLWGDRIFITTAVPTSDVPPQAANGTPQRSRAGGGSGGGQEHKFLVLCLDRNTGKILWERTAKTAAPHEGYHGRYGSFASNSPVTDGTNVFAYFGSRGLFCYDLNGKLIWEKEFPQMRMLLQFGEGVAPVLDGDRLYVKVDHEGDSFLTALEKKSGKELWRTPRDEGSSWSEPLVVTHEGRKQVVVSATNKVRAYDAADGKVIWECAGLGRNVIPAPVTTGGLVIVMSGYRDPNLLAIRLGREGDLTGTDAVVWTNNRGNPYTPSPVLQDGKLYLLTDNGMLSCLNALTGEAYYHQQRLPKPYNFKASPVAAAGRLYLATEEGDVVVAKAGEKYEVLATNTLSDESFIATPAIAGGSMYLRGRNTLYCIRE